MEKQTAVEWLQEKIFNSDWQNMIGEDKLKLFEQAKEMEEKQKQTEFLRGSKESKIYGQWITVK